jgi:hypothetical protein
MELALTDPQVLVLATRVKGEVTWAPLAGVLTVMADAGTIIPENAKAAKSKVFIRYASSHGRARIGAERVRLAPRIPM